jgi:hypothetical protein
VAAAAYLKGAALMWWSNATTTGVDNPATGVVVINTWERFKSWFLVRFQPIAVVKTARARLCRLKQRGVSVAAYTNEFLQLMQMIPDMSSADQIQYYVSGLSNVKVVEQVELKEPKSLLDAMEIAQQTDLRVKDLLSRFDSNNSRHGSFRSSSFHTRTAPAQQSVPMDLTHMRTDDGEWDDGADVEWEQEQEQKYSSGSDSFNSMSYKGRGHGSNRGGYRGGHRGSGKRVPGLTRDDYVKLSAAKKCFNCREEGHFARDCTKPLASTDKQSGKGKAQ